MYAWIGGAIQSIINSWELRTAQQNELEEAFKDISTGVLTPIRRTRNFESKVESQSEFKSAKGRSRELNQSQPALDPRDLVPAVDLVSILSKSEFETEIQEKKVRL